MGLKSLVEAGCIITHAMYECVGRCIARAYEWNDSTAAKTSVEATLTFTVKLALDAVHTDIHLVRIFSWSLEVARQRRGSIDYRAGCAWALLEWKLERQ